MILEKLMDMASSKNVEDLLLAMTIFEQQSQLMGYSELNLHRSILYTQCINSASKIYQEPTIIKRIKEVYKNYPFVNMSSQKYYTYSFDVTNPMVYALHDNFIIDSDLWEPLMHSEKIRKFLSTEFHTDINLNHIEVTIQNLYIEIVQLYSESQINLLEYDINRLTYKYTHFLEDYNILKTKAEDLEAEVDELESAIDSKDERIVSLEQEIQDLTKDHSSSSIKP